MKLYINIYFTFFYFISFSNLNIDSIIEYDIEPLIQNGDYSRAEKELLKLKLTTNELNQGYILYELCRLNIYASDYSEAISIAEKTKILASKINDSILLNNSNYLMANIYYSISNYKKSKILFIELTKQKEFDLEKKINCFISLSDIEYNESNPKQQIKYLESALYLTDSLYFPTKHNQIKARYHQAKKEYKKAIYYLNLLINDSSSNLFSKVNCLNLKALNYFHLNEDDSAIKNYEKVFDIAIELNEQTIIEGASNDLLKLYEKKNDSINIEKYTQILKKISSINPISKKLQEEKPIKKTVYFYLFLALLLCITFYFIYFIISIRNKKERLDTKNKLTKEKEASNFVINETTKQQVKDKLIYFEKEKLYLKKGIGLRGMVNLLEIKNEKYIREYLKQELKTNFTDYLNDLRINYAIEKLNTDKKFKNYTIEQISYEIGYNSRTSFINAFKQKTGKTPIEYIKG